MRIHGVEEPFINLTLARVLFNDLAEFKTYALPHDVLSIKNGSLWEDRVHKVFITLVNVHHIYSCISLDNPARLTVSRQSW